MILPSYNTSVRSKLDEYMESNNIKLSPIIEADTSEMILELVKDGLGIGYLVKDLATKELNKTDYEIIAFDNTLPVVDICCVYIEDFVTTAAKKFIKILKTEKE